MNKYSFFLCSSLEKVFPDCKPKELEDNSCLTVWKNTRASIQLVYYSENDNMSCMPLQDFSLEIIGGPCKCDIRKVDLVPSDFPCYCKKDDDYITDKPGLFPDLLSPLNTNYITVIPGQYRSLWISWDIPEDVESGIYEITIKAKAVDKKMTFGGWIYEDKEIAGLEINNKIKIRVCSVNLKEQKLIHTQWFHADCLANFYNTETFDERHWQIIENFIHAAGCRHGINMILTPIITPPLDTAKGGERRTVQLVDINYNNNKYEFNFDKLRRWARICLKNNIKYLEIAHLFTQWGASSAPKVMVTEDGEYKQLFGWNTKALSKDYIQFLTQLLPKVKEVLSEEGYDEKHVYYHISDEPSLDQLESYKEARNVVNKLINDEQIIDALSNVEFYKQGIVSHPIPGTTEIEDFYKENIEGLWCYYCCAQCKDVPNRFFAMKSARNRIMGVLMYLYNIEGFLHWGYNFYNSKFSLKPINPFVNTHADYGFPSGDAFLVYPGDNGMPLDSIRIEVQDEGLLDLRALQLLESLTSKEFVENVIYEGSSTRPFSFINYPKDDEWLLRLRERVGNEIEKCNK